MTNPEEEIDLHILVRSTYHFFQRNLRWLFGGSIAGMLIGLIGYFSMPSIFASRMIFVSDILTTSYANELTQSINQLISERNDSLLSGRFSISVAQAASLKSLTIESLNTVVNGDQVQTTFALRVKTKDRSILPDLQQGIITYLRNNEYVKPRVRQRETMYTTLIEKLDIEIKSLDSLKDRFVKGKPISAGGSGMLLVDPANIYSTLVDLTRQKLEYQNSLELFYSIQLVDGFTPFKDPVSPKLWLSLLLGFVAGFLLTLMMITFRVLLKEDAPGA